MLQIAAKVISGEETFVQIVFTILLAIWTAFYLFFTLRIPISQHVRLLLEFQSTEMSAREQNMHKINAIQYAYIAFVTMIGTLFLIHLMVYIVDLTTDIEIDWIQSLITVCSIF